MGISNVSLHAQVIVQFSGASCVRITVQFTFPVFVAVRLSN